MTCSDKINIAISIIATTVEIIVAILTLFTLRAAIKANKQNREEIVQAQKAIQVSIKIQEQTKNIELLDKRANILERVENYQYPSIRFDPLPGIANGIYSTISINEIRIMFRDDPGILADFKAMTDSITNARLFGNQLNIYYMGFVQSDGEGGKINAIWDQILRYEAQIQSGSAASTMEEFQEYCAQHTYIDQNSGEEYNYFFIKKGIEEHKESFETAQKNLIMKIRVFIDESIKPIDTM